MVEHRLNMFSVLTYLSTSDELKADDVKDDEQIVVSLSGNSSGGANVNLAEQMTHCAAALSDKGLGRKILVVCGGDEVCVGHSYQKVF